MYAEEDLVGVARPANGPPPTVIRMRAVTAGRSKRNGAIGDS
jgi:hypothetical protein